MENTKNFTEGKIFSPLMGFALPVLLALFLQTMYGAVDMLIVGQFGNAASVSAVSTGSWMMQVITSAIVGLAMGTTILLGQKIGEGRLSDAGRVVGASICMFIVIGIAVTVLMQLFGVPFWKVMQTLLEAFDDTINLSP